jgi:hypothetical protein
MLIFVLLYGHIKAKMMNHIKLEHLQCSFPKLTEANQQYVLGVAEGLKYTQDKPGESPEKRAVLPQGNGRRGDRPLQDVPRLTADMV